MDSLKAAHPVVWMTIGAVVGGLGNLLASQEQLSWRIVVGRAMSSGALGVATALLIVVWPDIPPFALAGAAALAGSLGTSGLERLLQIIMRRNA